MLDGNLNSNDNNIINTLEVPPELIEIEDQNIKEILNESSHVNHFFEKDRNSLMLYQEKKEEMFERLRLEWKNHHNRIQDFKTRSLAKYPQVFFLNYQTFYDPIRKIQENKSNVISKYTFNLDEDIELDLGGSIYSRDNLGLGSIFSSLRFYSLNNKLFNNFTYSVGDYQNLKVESNYLFSNFLLLDYIYSKNNFRPDHKHKFTIHKLVNSDFKMNFGFKFLNKLENLTCFIKSKRIFSAQNSSLDGSLKFNSKELKLLCKYKENIENLYLISSLKISFDSFFPTFSSHNQIWYKYYNRFLKFGYFYNFDGLGLEIGYQSAGLKITIPFVILKPDFNSDDELKKSLSESLLKFSQQFIIFIGLNYICKYAIKKVKKFFKKKEKNQIKTEEIKKQVTEKRNQQESFVSSMKIFVDNKYKQEFNKQFGLLIDFAVYGKLESLNEIIYNSETKDFFEFLSQYVKNIDNQVIEVTIPVKNLIIKDEKSSVSKILFYQNKKTKIAGFINPIYESDEEAYLLIKYTINNTSKFALKADSQYFQIPESIFT
jgi:hypothetical protein